MYKLSSYEISTWVRRYWFHAALAALFMFVLLRRDLSFQISFKQPTASLASENTAHEIAAASVGTAHSTYRDDLPAAVKRRFIQRFMGLAQQETAKFGIPTSIILAQAIFQTQAGTNPLAQKGNNFFKIKTSASWHGETYKAKTGVYKAYSSPWASFRDHSEAITSGEFADLRTLSPSDYKAWARALEAHGYNGQKGLADCLIGIIEANDLAASKPSEYGK